MNPRSNFATPQGGAALVIGLILLLVLTVLAISGVNSASLEFFMAGNEQYRQNAFQAAETGIEQAFATAQFNPGAAQTLPGTNLGSDRYSATVTPQLGGAGQIPTDGSSLSKYSTYYYEITSTGTSTRNAQAINVQGAKFTTNGDPIMRPDVSNPNKNLN